MPLLKNTVLLLALSICATAATVPPAPQVSPSSVFTVDNSDLEAMKGPLPSRWRKPKDPSRVPSKLKEIYDRVQEQREQRLQENKVAFRLFSEKVVSDRCTDILASTLDRLDTVRETVHDYLKDKESNDLLEPVLAPLTRTLRMSENFYYEVELIEVEVEENEVELIDEPVEEYEKKDKDEEYQEEDEEEDEEEDQEAISTEDEDQEAISTNTYPSLAEVESPQNETVRGEVEDGRFSRFWTEENEPQLTLKYRLRRLEKALALFPYTLRFAPDPVREELESNGFVQLTKAFREDLKALLTCEGVTHVTVAQLGDKLGGYESDNHMDRDAARLALVDLSNENYYRLLNYFMNFLIPSSPRTANGPQNTAEVVDREPVEKPSEERQQLKEQVVDDQSLFLTPEVKFSWTWEAIVRLWKAADLQPEKNPELAALLFQE